MRACFVVPVCWALGACAFSPMEIPTADVSQEQFKKLDCRGIEKQATYVTQRVAELTGAGSTAQEGSGIVLYWPAAAMLKIDDKTTAELSRLKGEFQALQQASLQKGCKVQLREATGVNYPLSRIITNSSN